MKQIEHVRQAQRVASKLAETASSEASASTGRFQMDALGAVGATLGVTLPSRKPPDQTEESRSTSSNSSRSGFIVICAIAALVVFRPMAAQAPQSFAKWESAIAAFEKEDKEKPPAANGIEFVGSSTIRVWGLEKSFPKLNALNRGFGGSRLGDSAHFLPRLVLKHEPRLVVVYAGQNDLAASKRSDQVAAEFEAFASQVRYTLPKTRIVFITIKPSIMPWRRYDMIQKANGLIEASCRKHDRCAFVDIAPLILGKDSKPSTDFFRADGHYFSDNGYGAVSKALEPHLQHVAITAIVAGKGRQPRQP